MGKYVILGLLAGLALFVAAAFLFAHLRMKELLAWCAKRGFSLDSETDPSFKEQFPGLKCLTLGRQQSARNVMRGQHAGREICAFDYKYVDGVGKSRKHCDFSGVIVNSGLAFQPLEIRTETFADKIGAFLGFEDINFESAEFSQQFYVSSPDRRFAFDVLTQRSMEFLLASPRFRLEFHGPYLCAYRAGVFSTAEFEDALMVVTGLLDRLPPVVVRELKGKKR